MTRVTQRGLVIFCIATIICYSFSKIIDIYWHILSLEALRNAVHAEIADRHQFATAFGPRKQLFLLSCLL